MRWSPVAAFAALLWWGEGSVRAATINVGCGDVPGLVAAIQTAASGDTVQLASSCTYTLTVPFSGVDGLPAISNTLTIQGQGSTITRSTNAGTALFRILHVAATGNLTLGHVTLSNGALDNFPGQNGGGVLNEGTLTTDHITVSGNKAFQGGGVNSTKTLVMNNSNVDDNEGTDHGGGVHIYGTASLTDCEVTNNSAWILTGGILTAGPLTLRRTRVSGNSGGGTGGVMAYVGANSSLVIIDSEISGNNAASSAGIFSYGGLIFISGSTITGNVASSSCGGIETSGTLWIVSSTISSNQAGTDGGGICAKGPLLLSGSTVTGNAALFGAGLSASGSSFISRTTFSSNVAGAGGGGILASGSMNIVESTFSGNTAQFGGGVKSYGTLAVNRCTFSGNDGNFGGGLAVLFPPAQATVVNSTFWQNASALGGGILTYGTLRVLSSTLGANTANASDGGGGIHVVSTGSLELRNSIVASNTAPRPNVQGTVNSVGFNVIGDITGSSGWLPSDVTGVVNAGLASLASNGGPTQSVAINLASPARDLVPTASCVDETGAPLTIDQRLALRPSGSRCDAGAFERFALRVFPPFPFPPVASP